MIPGLALGRVVHYVPSKDLDDLGHLSDDEWKPLAILQGRIARIDEPSAGLVTLALDVPAPLTQRWALGMTYFATARAYDEDSKPGTWRYPPRV